MPNYQHSPCHTRLRRNQKHIVTLVIRRVFRGPQKIFSVFGVVLFFWTGEILVERF